MFFKIPRLFAICCLLLITNNALAQVFIQQIRSNTLPDKLQVIADVENKPTFRAFTVANPPRLVVDIDVNGIKKFPNRATFSSNDMVKRVRTGIQSARRIRMVIDLKKKVSWNVYTAPSKIGSGYHLFVDLNVKSSVSRNQSPTTRTTSKTAKISKPTATAQSDIFNETTKKPEVTTQRIEPATSTLKSEPAEAEDKPTFFGSLAYLFSGGGANWESNKKASDENQHDTSTTATEPPQTTDNSTKQKPQKLPQQPPTLVSTIGNENNNLGLPLNIKTSNRIYRFRANRQAEKMQFVLDVAKPPTFKAFSLSQPNRIVVDIASLSGLSYRDLIGQQGYRGVLKIRKGSRSRSVHRLVFDLAKNYHWEVSTLLPDNRHGYRLVIDIYDKASSPQLTSTTNNLSASQTQSLSSTTFESLTVPPQKKSPVNRTPRNNQNIKSNKITIMIDPGHGGRDNGATGASGTKEKNITLDIAKRLKRKIDNLPGMQAILTRSTDRYLSLPKRTRLARQYRADLFVSIHADAFRMPEVSGSSVYVLSEEGTSEAAEWLAKKENAVDEKYGIGIKKYDDIGKVLVDIQQDATIESSYIVAKELLISLGKIGKLHKHKVERANFSVLRSPGIPSVLVETAYLSNPKEESKLKSPKYREKVATTLAKAINAYFKAYIPHRFTLINVEGESR